MRIDKFIFRYIEYLDGKLKLTSKELNEKIVNEYSDILSQVKIPHEDIDKVNLEIEKNVEMEKVEKDSL